MYIWISLHCPTSYCHWGGGREKAKFMAHVNALKLPTRFSFWLLWSAWGWDHPVKLTGFGVPAPAALLAWRDRQMEPLCVLKNLDIAVTIRDVFEVERNLHSRWCNNFRCLERNGVFSSFVLFWFFFFRAAIDQSCIPKKAMTMNLHRKACLSEGKRV